MAVQTMTDKILHSIAAKHHGPMVVVHCELYTLAEALCGDLPRRYCPETERIIDGEQI